MASQIKESTFQNKIIRKLKKLDNCWYCKIWGGGFQKSGIPDIIICYKGKFIGVELKTDKGIISPLQKATLNLINNARGETLVLRPNNEQDLWDLLERIYD